MTTHARPAAAAAALALLLAPASAQPTFRVTFDESVRDEPASGRLVVYLIAADSALPDATEPAEGPHFDDPQPMFGADVRNLAPGDEAAVDATADAFPAPLDQLPPGRYRVQAVLRTNRASSDWRREPGNLYSAVDTFSFDEGQRVDVPIRMLHRVRATFASPWEADRNVELVELRSKLLSDFRGQDVTLRAGVVLPAAHDPDRAYPAVYEVPGFGGDHQRALAISMERRAARSGPLAELAAGAFWIVLDPDGPHGHHLFTDSANNGPVARALTEELIPAIESRFNLVREPSARILRGHSSGGWTVLRLALDHPDVFGAAWSTAPDPVDFTRFQRVNIYADINMYTDEYSGEDHPSYSTLEREPRMSIREENLMEEVLGPRNTSSQQWDSWMAVFGPRAPDGTPDALYDRHTGRLDRTVARHFREHDIAERLRRDPGRYLPVFHKSIRLLCGDRDNYDLHLAVERLKATAEDLGRQREAPHEDPGYIRLLEGHDHSTIHYATEVLAFPAEMLEHLRAHGHIPAGAEPAPVSEPAADE